MTLKVRNQHGYSMIAIVICAAFFILLPLGIFGFELLRFSIAQMQLRSVCDAAALSGAVGVASAKPTFTADLNQQYAMESAFITFKQNNIFGKSLDAAGTTAEFNTTTPIGTPAPGECIVKFTLLDQNFVRVNTGDPAAKLIRCEAVYGYRPPIGGELGFVNTPVQAFSEGGLPQLDIVLCYDVSGSMDDQTRVSFVKRHWDGANGVVKYDVVSVPKVLGGSPPNPPGSIYNVNYPKSATGTRVNATAPQNLSFADFPYPLYTSGNRYPYQFSPDLRCKAAVELGSPPGNKTDGTVSTGSATTFTDVVVNIDGKDTFAGHNDVVSGLNFPNIGTLVEASRGNLNLPADFDSASPGHTTSLPTTSASAGYKTTYDSLARSYCQPIQAANNAAANFFTTMNISANCHFGFVAFSDDIGTLSTSLWEPPLAASTKKRIDPTYTLGGDADYPLPLVPLIKTPANTNFAEVQAAVGSLVATGKTNISAALAEGIRQLNKTNGLTRDKARRAIVLFTDGVPNLPGGDVAAQTAAWSQADFAASKGIQIYCIGLSQNPDIIGPMGVCLSKIASKTKGKYYSVTTTADLDAAFQNIAKSLVVLR